MRFAFGALFMTALAAPAAAPAQRPPAGFVLEISFSPRAAAEMSRLREAVTVAAYYEGEPRPAYRRRATDDGLITLGEERVTVPGAGRVTITGRNFIAVRSTWVLAPSVNVNIFSARRTSRDNLLNCDLVAGPLTEIAGRVHTVRCRLIGE